MSDDAITILVLKKQLKEMKQRQSDAWNLSKRNAGNVVEMVAYITKCKRHQPKLRGCTWVKNKPCLCRAKAAKRFPEYSDEVEHAVT